VARKISIIDMTAEQRTEHHYRTKERECDELWAKVNALKDTDPKLGQTLTEIDKAQRAMFRSFDNWQHQLKNTITVPIEDAVQLMVDAIMGNSDGLLESGDSDGLARHREAMKIANDLFSTLKWWGVKVREYEFERRPFCDDCEEELSA
jgi:hypothetical protein